MTNWGKVAFVAGLVLAIVAAYVDSSVLPWLVAGLGVAVGLFNVSAGEAPGFLVSGIALTVALIAIQDQHYNPAWLTNVVFYVKVFVTHVLLPVSFVAVVRVARD